MIFFSLWIHISKPPCTYWILLNVCMYRTSGYQSWEVLRWFSPKGGILKNKRRWECHEQVSYRSVWTPLRQTSFSVQCLLNLCFVQWSTRITLTFAFHDFWMFKTETFMLNWQMTCINIKLDLGKSFNL